MATFETEEERKARELREQEAKPVEPSEPEEIPRAEEPPKAETPEVAEQPAIEPQEIPAIEPQLPEVEIPEPEPVRIDIPEIPQPQIVNEETLEETPQQEVGQADTEEARMEIDRRIQESESITERANVEISDKLDELERMAGDDVDQSISAYSFGNWIPSGAGGFELGSKVCFGNKIDGTTVTIYSGEIDRIAVSETNVASVADDNYIYVRRTIADDTMLVTKGASVPADDDEYKYYKLYQFSVADSVASIKRIWRPFAIEDAEDELPAGGVQYQVLQMDATASAAWGLVTEDNIDTTGITQYKVLQADGSGNADWDWVRAHA